LWDTSRASCINGLTQLLSAADPTLIRVDFLYSASTQEVWRTILSIVKYLITTISLVKSCAAAAAGAPAPTAALALPASLRLMLEVGSYPKSDCIMLVVYKVEVDVH
jgi:hypothetical protein